MSGPDAGLDPSAVAVALAGGAVDTTVRAGRLARSVIGPVAVLVLRPALLPASLQPATYLEAAAAAGEARRARLALAVSRLLDDLVPVVLDHVLRRAGMTDVVLRYVDLDRVVSAVDLDAVVAQVDVAAVVQRVDLDEVVARVDLDAAAARLDIDAVLDRLDLTALVLHRVDLHAIVEAVLARLDLVGLAAEVIDGVDLPEIIRESTGSMASDTVRGVRMQSIAADEALGRAVDRLLLRRGGRSTQAPDRRAPEGADSSR